MPETSTCQEKNPQKGQESAPQTTQELEHSEATAALVLLVLTCFSN